jgi:uncharacterized protein YlxW (UPF0749 family)
MQTPIEEPEMSAPEPLPVEGEQPGPSPRLSWKLLVPVVTAGAGVMFAMSFSAAQGSDLRSDRDLTQLILERNEQVAEKAVALDQLRREVDVLSTAAAPSDERVSALTKTADELATSAAATKLTGPGLSVSLTDAQLEAGELPEGFTPDDVVVHQQDVQAVVDLHERGPLRRQHPHPPGPRLRPALRHHGDR